MARVRELGDMCICQPIRAAMGCRAAWGSRRDLRKNHPSRLSGQRKVKGKHWAKSCAVSGRKRVGQVTHLKAGKQFPVLKCSGTCLWAGMVREEDRLCSQERESVTGSRTCHLDLISRGRMNGTLVLFL